MYEFKETGKDTARMGIRNGLKKGLFQQKSEKKLRKKERMLQNSVLQHPLCLQSDLFVQVVQTSFFAKLIFLCYKHYKFFKICSNNCNFRIIHSNKRNLYIVSILIYSICHVSSIRTYKYDIT